MLHIGRSIPNNKSLSASNRADMQQQQQKKKNIKETTFFEVSLFLLLLSSACMTVYGLSEHCGEDFVRCTYVCVLITSVTLCMVSMARHWAFQIVTVLLSQPQRNEKMALSRPL